MHIIDVARRRRNIMEEVVTSAFPYLTPPSQESLVKTVLDLLPPDLRDAGLLDLAENGTFFEEFQARQRTLLEDIRKKSAAEEETASKKAAANAARSKSKAEFWAKKGKLTAVDQAKADAASVDPTPESGIPPLQEFHVSHEPVAQQRGVIVPRPRPRPDQVWPNPNKPDWDVPGNGPKPEEDV